MGSIGLTHARDSFTGRECQESQLPGAGRRDERPIDPSIMPGDVVENDGDYEVHESFRGWKRAAASQNQDTSKTAESEGIRRRLTESQPGGRGAACVTARQIEF